MGIVSSSGAAEPGEADRFGIDQADDSLQSSFKVLQARFSIPESGCLRLFQWVSGSPQLALFDQRLD